MAVASSSKNANAMLRTVKLPDGTSLHDAFAVNVCGRDLRADKPDPEIFLLAAAELKILPMHCFVAEDATAGIQAARAGGMAGLGVARLGDAALLQAQKATLVVTSLDEVAVDELARGILARRPLCFAAQGIPQTEEARRAWRELIVTTPGLQRCISGAILYDETIRQRDRSGVLLVQHLVETGIISGIKVDLGAKPLARHPGENVTEGLDGLRARLSSYAAMGARFAKWRAVITLDTDIPSSGAIAANAHALARYAGLCQEAGLVPIVEPEVMMTGAHGIARCLEATEAILRSVFEELDLQRVALEAVVLKPNMVLPGLDCTDQRCVEDIAEATFQCLLRCVPAAVAGIAFLSGGQSGILATARLNAINLAAQSRTHAPWPLVFSFARAVQFSAMRIWNGENAHVSAAQQALYHRATCNRAALTGKYTEVMEDVPALRLAS